MPNGEVLEVPKDGLIEAAQRLLGRGFDNLHCITAVDNRDHIELVYSFYSLKEHAAVTLKVRLSGDLSVESLARSWKSADWLEREVFDLFGVIFLNHPNLKRILNPDEWTIHPLRKT